MGLRTAGRLLSRRVPHAAMWALVPVLLAGLGFASVAVCDPAEPSQRAPLLRAGGAVSVGSDGRARSLYQPEFRGAPWLKAQLGVHKLKGLRVDLVTPIVAVALPPGSRKPLPPTYSRLLLSGPKPAVLQARQILRRVDVAPRTAFVSILATEVRCWLRKNSGGSVLYDRGSGTSPSSTLFRGFGSAFEPDDYLRSTLAGTGPFEGTTLRFGDMNVEGGSFEYTLRMLYKQGEAEFLAWPNLLVTEGVPGSMESLRQVTEELTLGNRVGYSKLPVGLKLRVTPVRIGRETAVLDLDVWLQNSAAVVDSMAPPGSVILKGRQVRTRLTVRDREPLVFGGIVLGLRERSRNGLPRPKTLEVLDPVFSSWMRDRRDTEIVFVVRVRIPRPGEKMAETRPGIYEEWSKGKTSVDPWGR